MDDGKRDVGQHAPQPTTDQSSDWPPDFFRIFKIWFWYVAIFLALHFVFLDIPVSVWSVLGAIGFALGAAFINAVFIPEGPYEQRPSLTWSERLFRTIGILFANLVIVAIVVAVILSLAK